MLYPHRNLLHLLEVDHLDDRHGVVVVRRTIAAGVGHIHVVVHDLHLLGLVAHGDFVGDAHRECVDLVDSSFGCIRVDQHRAYVGADIGIPTVEADIAAVGYVDLAHGKHAAQLSGKARQQRQEHCRQDVPLHLP